jgi:uncharacterized protein
MHGGIKGIARKAQLRIFRASPFCLHIRRSKVHRFGVFAGKPIPAHVKVIEYTGERISRREARRRFLRMVNRHGNKRIYLARLNLYWVIDGSAGGNGAELINHSCDPNIAPRRGRGRLWFVSLRKICSGEELVADYRFPRETEVIPCHCGSPLCRGTINVR